MPVVKEEPESPIKKKKKVEISDLPPEPTWKSKVDMSVKDVVAKATSWNSVNNIQNKFSSGALTTTPFK